MPREADRPDAPVAVVAGALGRGVVAWWRGGVVACSIAARAAGVRRGRRQRDAQQRSPYLTVLQRDELREAREFERVAVVVEDLVGGMEIVLPGLIAIGAGGPARYHGGELRLAQLIRDAIGELTTEDGDGLGAGVGMADGLFVASQAARRDLIVEPGAATAFLVPLPLRVLDQPQLAGTLVRLGTSTLGGFAALPVSDVATGFGAVGIEAHRLAHGLNPRPPVARRPGEDSARCAGSRSRRRSTSTSCSPPRASRPRRSAAESALGSGAWGDVAAGPLSAVAVAERVRWQLDGWRIREPYPTADPGGGTAPGPDQLVVDTGAQQALWGTEEFPGRVAQAAERVQAILGMEGVVRIHLVGGRDPASRVRYVPGGRVGQSGP